MAIRSIRTMGDEVLTKECKPVKEMTEHTAELIEDMFETMYEANGVGLAAPQVGIRKQIVVIDVDDGNPVSYTHLRATVYAPGDVSQFSIGKTHQPVGNHRYFGCFRHVHGQILQLR